MAFSPFCDSGAETDRSVAVNIEDPADLVVGTGAQLLRVTSHREVHLCCTLRGPKERDNCKLLDPVAPLFALVSRAQVIHGIRQAVAE